MKTPPRLLIGLLAMFCMLPATAGPGAHGPGGEHLDTAPVLSAGASVPRVEAKSETFELVARIESGALSILVDRYETNEPVLGAAVEVESGSLKAKAPFRREQGDYVVVDAALMKLLATPGSHPLVFTVSAGSDSDLLEGAMPVAAAASARTAMSNEAIAAWIAGALVAVGAAALFIRSRGSRGALG
jgi:hypothetical protein